VDPTTFKGKVKIKVGPITVAYSGTARIADRDDAHYAATLEADGRETTGPGSARAKARMTVEAEGSGSIVKIVTDYSVAGRVAQFGRGVMEDVSRRIVNDMAACIKANVEAAEPGRGGGGGGEGGSEPGPGPALSSVAPMQTSRPINAFGLLFSVLWARLTGSRDAPDKLPMEALDSATAGIGVLLAASAVISLALAAAVVVSGINAILHT
jgi:carbon monoxide dehydrogenase subunit G